MYFINSSIIHFTQTILSNFNKVSIIIVLSGFMWKLSFIYAKLHLLFEKILLARYLVRYAVINVEQVPEQYSSVSAIRTGDFAVHFYNFTQLHNLPGYGLVRLLPSECSQCAFLIMDRWTHVLKWC